MNVYLAKILLIDGFGLVGFTSALISFLYLFSNFGLDLYLISVVSKKANNDNVYLITGIYLKIVLSILSFLILFVFTLSLNSKKEMIFVLIWGATLFSTALNINWYFQSHNMMTTSSVYRIIESMCYTALSFLLLNIFKNMNVIPISLLISQLTINLYFIHRERIVFRKIKLRAMKILFLYSAPIGFSMLMILIYYNLDLVLIKYFKGNYETGVYNISVRFFLFALIPLNSILTVFFPKLSKFKNFNKELKSLFFKYGGLLILTSAAISLFILIFADKIVLILFTEKYLDSIYPLKIFGINIMIVGLNIFLGNPLLAWNRRKYYMIAISLGAVLNVSLNLIFIPEYSFVGSAWATVASEIVVFLTFLIIYFKFIIKDFMTNAKM